MDLARGLEKRRGAWRAVFFCALSIFVLFWGWMLAAAVAGQAPVSLVRLTLVPRARGGQSAAAVPISSYIRGDFGVLAITPADNRTTSVNENGRRILITFAGPMDTDTSHVLRSWELETHSNEELDFRAFSWSDAMTFIVTLNRDLLPEERVALSFRFRKAGGEPVRPLRLVYE